MYNPKSHSYFYKKKKNLRLVLKPNKKLTPFSSKSSGETVAQEKNVLVLLYGHKYPGIPLLS